MTKLRTDTPRLIAHHEVTAVSDYMSLKKKSFANEGLSDLACRVSGDVIVLEFGDSRCRITVRPSGTEPKLKLYVQWYEDAEGNDSTAHKLQLVEINDMLESLSRELEGILLEG